MLSGVFFCCCCCLFNHVQDLFYHLRHDSKYKSLYLFKRAICGIFFDIIVSFLPSVPSESLEDHIISGHESSQSSA